MTLPRIADSLAGRMQVVRLLPLAQAEVRETLSSFLESAFTYEIAEPRNVVVGDMLVETVLAGGYPEALARSRWERRQDWHLNYVEALIQRDARTVASIERVQLMPRLLRTLAEHSGCLVNYSGLVSVRSWGDGLLVEDPLPGRGFNILDRKSAFVPGAAAALSAADLAGGPVAGSFEPRGLAEGLEQDGTQRVAAFPVVGQPPFDQGEGRRGF